MQGDGWGCEVIGLLKTFLLLSSLIEGEENYGGGGMMKGSDVVGRREEEGEILRLQVWKLELKME